MNYKKVKKCFLEPYQEQDSDMVEVDLSRFTDCPYEFILDNFIEVKNGYIRHNARKIVETILARYERDMAN